MTTVLFLKKPMVSTAKIPWQNGKECFFFLNYNFVTMLQHMVDRTLTFISLLVLHITQRIEFIYIPDIVLLKDLFKKNVFRWQIKVYDSWWKGEIYLVYINGSKRFW